MPAQRSLNMTPDGYGRFLEKAPLAGGGRHFIGGNVAHLICEHCGKPFCAHSPRQGCCSASCAQLHRAKKGLNPSRPVAERFWEKVDKGAGADGCWLWKERLSPGGYGLFFLSKKRGTARAHRVAWELTNGPIPAQIFVCHSCDNPRCVNPAHLFLGTPADNVRDRDMKGHTACGERTKACTLTNALVIEIRKLYAQGVRQVQIARLFGLKRERVWNIVHRYGWKHI
jgi:hypothetical protein